MGLRVIMVCGVIGLVTGLFGGGIGVMYLINPGAIGTVEDDLQGGRMLSTCCFPFVVLPSIIVIAYAWRQKKAEEAKIGHKDGKGGKHDTKRQGLGLR